MPMRRRRPAARRSRPSRTSRTRTRKRQALADALREWILAARLRGSGRSADGSGSNVFNLPANPIPGTVERRGNRGGYYPRFARCGRGSPAIGDANLRVRLLIKKPKDLQCGQSLIALFFRVPSGGIFFQQSNELQQNFCWNSPRRQSPAALFFRVPSGGILV